MPKRAMAAQQVGAPAVLALLLLRAAVATPGLAPQWSAGFTVGRMGPFTHGHGSFAYDGPGRRSRQIWFLGVDVFSKGQRMTYDISNALGQRLGRNITTGWGSDATCLADTYYLDLFDGIETASPLGTRVVRGEPCEAWAYNSTDGEVHSSVCLGPDGVPRQLNTTAQTILGRPTGVFGSLSSITFTDVEAGPPGSAAFAPTAACAEHYPARRCPADSVTELDIYRIRSIREPNELASRNAADALGSMGFLCMEKAGGGYKDKVVSRWQVLANASWGQYSFCLYLDGKNQCPTSTGPFVGRECAWGLNDCPSNGRCSDNTVLGSWYAFPGSGQCAPGQPVGTSGCTWAATRLRTVSAQCVFEERGLLAECAAQFGRAPYSGAAAILERALASDDPAKGGCPDVSAEGEAVVLV